MAVSSDRMYLQQEDGTMLALRAVAGVIQASTNGDDWADIEASGTGGSSTWYDVEAAAHAAAIPELTESVPIQVGVSNIAETKGTMVLDAAKEGGAIKGTGAAWGYLCTPTVWQNLATSKFACSFQGSFAQMASAKANYFALVNSTGTHGILIGTNNDTDATHFITFVANVTGTSSALSLGTADTNVYTWRVYSDGTTCTVGRYAADGSGAALASQTFLTNGVDYPTDSASPAIFANVTMTGQALYKVLYSFVGPA